MGVRGIRVSQKTEDELEVGETKAGGYLRGSSSGIEEQSRHLSPPGKLRS